MSYPGGGYTPYTQYGATSNQFTTTYTPASQSQNQYGVPPYNQNTTTYQQNTPRYSYNASYGQGNSSFNTYGQQDTQVYPQNNSYRQGPTSSQGGQYPSAAPPYNSDGSAPALNQPSYNQAPPSSHNQAPPPFSYSQESQYNQTPTSSYNQAPPPSHNQAPPTSYNQEPSPNYQENTYPTYQQGSYQQGPSYPQRFPYPQGANYPQQGNTYPPQNPSYRPQCPSYTSNEPVIGPQKPPKRPHMPHKLQTSFKQAKKTAAPPPQPVTSMQPLQGGKSAVSTVHDLAHQNGWTINWFEESETGPAHAKTFSMKVTMGPYEVSGSGRSKKLAKQDAAQLLVAQVTGNEVADIMGLPGFTGQAAHTTSEDYGPQLPQSAGEKANSCPPSGGDNPISMLDHVVKKHKLGEPQYITVCENGPLALQRFDIKVKIDDKEASGLGRSKKVAKRNAAQAMLDQLSRTQTGIQPPKKRIMFVKASSETSNTT